MMLQRRGTSALGVISLPPTFLISLPARLLVLLRRLNLAFLALVFFVFTMMMRPLCQAVVFELLMPLRWGIRLFLRGPFRIILNFR
jgi:hypothetical protein